MPEFVDHDRRDEQLGRRDLLGPRDNPGIRLSGSLNTFLRSQRSMACSVPGVGSPMSDAGSAGAATGTVVRPATLERYALDAGFDAVEVLPIDNDSFRFSRLHVTA